MYFETWKYIYFWGARSLRSLAHISYKYMIFFSSVGTFGGLAPPPPIAKGWQRYCFIMHHKPYLVPKFPKSPHPSPLVSNTLLNNIDGSHPHPLYCNQMHCQNVFDFSGKDEKFGQKMLCPPPPPPPTEMVPYAYVCLPFCIRKLRNKVQIARERAFKTLQLLDLGREGLRASLS